MEREGDRYVQLAKRLGATDREVDYALAANPQLGLGQILDEAA